MSASYAQKRSATEDINPLSKRFRIVNENNDALSPATAPSVSTSATIDDAQSEVGTDITEPELCGDARRLNQYICPFDGCGKAYNRPCRLADHIRSHTSERPFLCTEEGCSKTFTRDAHLKRHVKSAHVKEANYHCEWEGCDKSFNTNTRLRRHQEVHANAERFRCTDYPPCDQSFRKHKTLQTHITTVHLNTKPYPCPHNDPSTDQPCRNAYETSGKLESHIMRVHGGEMYFCTLCETGTEAALDDGDDIHDTVSITTAAGFKTYHALQMHIKDVHPPICIECNQAFNSRRELRSHIDLSHDQVPADARRTHICTTCSKGFTRLGNLKVHINTVHNSARPFSCASSSLSASKHPELATWDRSNACTGTFKTKQQLENHIRTEHLGLDSEWVSKRRKRLANGDVAVRKVHGFFPLPDRPPRDPLAELTGVGYEEQHHIACLDPACEHRFTQSWNLRRHCELLHGMAESEVLDAIAEREALSGGQFWVGGVEPGYEDGDEDGDLEGMDDWVIDPELVQVAVDKPGDTRGMERVMDFVNDVRHI